MSEAKSANTIFINCGNWDCFNVNAFHMQTNPTPGKWVYVDAEKEAADLYILNHAVKQDIVVTQDTGLASMLVSRGVYALSPRGKYYNDDEMNTVPEDEKEMFTRQKDILEQYGLSR